MWAIGASRGAVSAAALGANPRGARLDGVVLTAPAVRGSRRDGDSVSGLPLAGLRPGLVIVQHAADACMVSRAADVAALAKQVKGARLILLRQPSAGEGHPCRGRSPHGFWGLDAAYVRAIVGAVLKGR